MFIIFIVAKMIYQPGEILFRKADSSRLKNKKKNWEQLIIMDSFRDKNSSVQPIFTKIGKPRKIQSTVFFKQIRASKMTTSISLPIQHTTLQKGCRKDSERLQLRCGATL